MFNVLLNNTETRRTQEKYNNIVNHVIDLSQGHVKISRVKTAKTKLGKRFNSKNNK